MSPRWTVDLVPAFSLLAALALGCGERAGISPAVVRDSAGIRITEHSRLPDRRLVVGDRPLVAVGSAAGEPGDALHRVRGAALLDSGLVVANSGTSQIFFYDWDSRLVAAIGTEGDGPGEFRRIASLLDLDGDTIGVFDSRNRRLSYLDETGDFVGATTLRTTGESGVLNPVGPLRGAVLVRATPPRATGERIGLIRDTVGYQRIAPDREPPADGGETAEFQPLATQPGDERWATAVADGVGWRPLLFGHESTEAACGEAFFLASGDAYEIRAFDPAGRLTGIIRVDVPRREVDDRLVDAAIADRVAGVTDSVARRAQERIWAETPRPEVLPAHGEIFASPDCDVWVRDYPVPDERVEWTVFTRAGEIRGRVRMPAGFEQLLAVYDERFVALFEDELGVEQVRAYTIAPTG